MKVITLCGSTKFKQYFERVNAILTLQGHVVLSVGVFIHSDSIELSKEQKTRLDELHRRKIDLSDEIFVIDIDGYIGSSTRNEIEYAWSCGKPINFLSKNSMMSSIDSKGLFEINGCSSE